jgi:hypothetical protein
MILDERSLQRLIEDAVRRGVQEGVNDALKNERERKIRKIKCWAITNNGNSPEARELSLKIGSLLSNEIDSSGLHTIVKDLKNLKDSEEKYILAVLQEVSMQQRKKSVYTRNVDDLMNIIINETEGGIIWL